MYRIIYLLPFIFFLSCQKENPVKIKKDCDGCDVSFEILKKVEYDGEVYVLCSNNPMPVRNIKAKAQILKVTDSTYAINLLLNKDSVFIDRRFQFDIECITLECDEREFELIHGDSLVSGTISQNIKFISFIYLDSSCHDNLRFSGTKI